MGGLLELLLVFGVVLGLAVIELVMLHHDRRSKREKRNTDDEGRGTR